MNKERRLGIWLIAAYWFARSGAVAIVLMKAHTDPDFLQQAVRLTNALGPFMWILHPDSQMCLKIGPASVLVGLCAGIGFLFYQRWALAIALLDRIFPLIRFLVFVPILLVVDKGALLSMNDSTLKALDFLSTMLMAAYFINPEVRALFGFS